MTPEQEKCAAEAYRRWRGIEPPLPREEVERRVREALDASKDDDFAVVKNLHVIIKNHRPAWYFKFTPTTVTASLDAIRISKPKNPKERPVKIKLGNYSDVRSCESTRTITYDIAFERVERLRDFLKTARQDMPEIDERNMFRLWSRGSQSDVASLSFHEREYLKMLVNIIGWSPAPATGWSEDDTDVDYYDDEIETDETQPVQIDEEEGYQIIEEDGINPSNITDWEQA
jgi:hypothetical protein